MHFVNGVVAGGGQCEGAVAPSKFWAVGRCRKMLFLSGNFRPKIQKLGLKTAIWGKFRGKIDFLSTDNLLCRKYAAVCRKIATSCPAYFLPTTPLHSVTAV